MSFFDAGLILITGAMFAGKSTTLIHKIRSYIEMQVPTLVIKHSSDTRYEEGKICSHDGEGWPAQSVTKLAEVDASQHSVIFVDEGQFFDDLEEVCRRWVFTENKRVYVAGLHAYSSLEPFGQIHLLLAFAEDVIWLKTFCRFCNRQGSYARYIGDEKKTGAFVEVGTEERWASVCIRHHSPEK